MHQQATLRFPGRMQWSDGVGTRVRCPALGTPGSRRRVHASLSPGDEALGGLKLTQKMRHGSRGAPSPTRRGARTRTPAQVSGRPLPGRCRCGRRRGGRSLPPPPSGTPSLDNGRLSALGTSPVTELASGVAASRWRPAMPPAGQLAQVGRGSSRGKGGLGWEVGRERGPARTLPFPLKTLSSAPTYSLLGEDGTRGGSARERGCAARAGAASAIESRAAAPGCLCGRKPAAVAAAVPAPDRCLPSDLGWDRLRGGLARRKQSPHRAGAGAVPGRGARLARGFCPGDLPSTGSPVCALAAPISGACPRPHPEIFPIRSHPGMSACSGA